MMPRHTEVPLSYRERVRKRILLNREEEAALAKRKNAGDRDAFDELVVRNQGLVIRIAERYYHANRHICTHVDVDDLVQEGNIGLMKAVEKFDPRMGKLSTYATRWIRKYVYEASLDFKGTIYEPLAFQQLRSKIRKTTDMLADKGLIATPALLSSILKVDKKEISAIQKILALSYTSFDEEIGEVSEDAGDVLHSIVPDAAAMKPEVLIAAREALVERCHVVEQVLVTLDTLPVPAMHKDAFKAANGLTPEGRVPLSAIGRTYHMTKANVSLIVIAVWKKLHAAGITLTKATLELYLEQIEAINDFIEAHEWVGAT